MVDIHAHILHGLDDGAVSPYMSVNMAKMAAAAGTTDIVATPHANSTYACDPAMVAQRLNDLQKAVGDSPRIHRGCHLDLSWENLALALREPSRFAINGLNYMLVELGAAQVAESERIFSDLRSAGLTPIVIQPERNRFLARNRDLIHRWVDSGVPVQIASRSLTGEAGQERAAWCLDAIEEGLVHFVASDAHDTTLRPPTLDRARRLLESEFGADHADLLLKQNPRAAIEGRPVGFHLIPRPRRKSTKWFLFGGQ